MECAHQYLSVCHVRDALFHLIGGLIRKGQSQDGRGFDAMRHEIDDAAGDHAGFA